MLNVTAANLLDEVDKKQFNIYIEWQDLDFKLILLNALSRPFKGEMTTENINYFSNELSKSSNKYLQETKEALCGKNSEIQFFIRDKTLEWKKGIWMLGRITLHPITNIEIISASLKKVLNHYQNIQENVETLKIENNRLQALETELTTKIQKMIEIKLAMEQDLYKKFLLILNAKKKKIQELKNILKEKDFFNESVFHACTDESADSSEESSLISKEINKIKKRKSVDNNDFVNKKKGKEVKMSESTNSDKKNEAGPHPSTSKDFANDDTEHITQQSCNPNITKLQSSLNFVEELSEDELFC